MFRTEIVHLTYFSDIEFNIIFKTNERLLCGISDEYDEGQGSASYYQTRYDTFANGS